MTEIVSDLCISILCSVAVTKTGRCLWSNILVISKLRTYLWLHTAFQIRAVSQMCSRSTIPAKEKT